MEMEKKKTNRRRAFFFDYLLSIMSELNMKVDSFGHQHPTDCHLQRIQPTYQELMESSTPASNDLSTPLERISISERRMEPPIIDSTDLNATHDAEDETSNDDANSTPENGLVMETATNENNSVLPSGPPISSRIRESGNVEQPRWQNDVDVQNCSSCNVKFTFFKRKHHCRKCGLIFCSRCCSRYCTFIPGSMVIEPEELGGNRIIRESYKYYEFRTCNSCFEEIKMLKEALGIVDEEAENTSETEDEENEEEEGAEEDRLEEENANRRSRRLRRAIRETSEGTDTNTDEGECELEGNRIVKHSQPREITMEVNDSTANLAGLATNVEDDGTRNGQETGNGGLGGGVDEDFDECPVCGISLQGVGESEREEHINKCVQDQEFGSPQGPCGNMKRDRNRMLVYTIPKDVAPDSVMINEDNECVICLDEFHPGDKVGRLECLCCFHYKCIKDWIHKKGYCECPVHSLHNI